MITLIGFILGWGEMLRWSKFFMNSRLLATILSTET